MRSRSFKIAFHFLLSIMLLVGAARCSNYFDEKKQDNEVTFANGVGSCLSKSGQVVKAFFKEDANMVLDDESIGLTVECYQDSLKSFVTNTKSSGERGNLYSPSDIYNFLRDFYPDYVISEERIASYMQVKAFLIGGNPKSISKKELNQIREIVPHFGRLLRNLKNHRKILLWQEELSADQDGHELFKQAFTTAKDEIGLFVAQVDKYQGKRSANVRNISQFLFSEYYGDSDDRYLSWLPLVTAFKNLVMFSDGETLQRTQFSNFVKQSLLSFEALSEFEYFILNPHRGGIFKHVGHIASFVSHIPAQLGDSSVFQGLGLKILDRVFDRFGEVAYAGVNQRPNAIIDFDRLEDFLLSIETAGLMGKKLTAKTLSDFLRRFFKKFVSPANSKSEDITTAKLNYILELLGSWVDRQKLLNELFRDGENTTVSFHPLERQLKGNKQLDQWIKILEKVNTHQWDEKSRVLFSNYSREFSYEELTVSNSTRLLIEVFLKPYNLNKTDVLKYVLKENDVQEIYLVLRILGVEMAFMDSRIYDSGRRTFMESNNFSSIRNNNQWMGYFESYEYLAVAMSSGELADFIYEDVDEDCLLDYQDVHHKRVIQKACFTQLIYKEYGNYFDHLGTIRNFWDNANYEQKKAYLDSLELASRAGEVSDKPYDLVNIRVMVTVTYYLQSIFNMFDTDGNGFAEGSELKLAERHFKAMITDFILTRKKDALEKNRFALTKSCGGGEKTDEQLAKCIAPKVFLYLLKEGALPETTNEWLTKFFPLMLQSNYDDAMANLKSGPGDVLKVFSALAIITHQGHINRLTAFLKERRGDLVNSLVDDEAPQCRQTDSEKLFEPSDHVFCRWAREIYCNETVNNDVYEYFKNNKYNLFPENEYKQDQDAAVQKTLENIHFTFKGHQKFSTLCGFPQVTTPAAESDEDTAEVEESGGLLKKLWGG